MANVLNRLTRELRRSANTPDYPLADWIVNPDLAAVEGLDPRYWRIVGDAVLAMARAERDAVDAAELAARVEAERASARVEVDGRVLKALAGIMLDEINALRAKASMTPRTADQLRTAILNRIGEDS